MSSDDSSSSDQETKTSTKKRYKKKTVIKKKTVTKKKVTIMDTSDDSSDDESSSSSKSTARKPVKKKAAKKETTDDSPDSSDDESSKKLVTIKTKKKQSLTSVLNEILNQSHNDICDLGNSIDEFLNILDKQQLYQLICYWRELSLLYTDGDILDQKINKRVSIVKSEMKSFLLGKGDDMLITLINFVKTINKKKFFFICSANTPKEHSFFESYLCGVSETDILTGKGSVNCECCRNDCVMIIEENSFYEKYIIKPLKSGYKELEMIRCEECKNEATTKGRLKNILCNHHINKWKITFHKSSYDNKIDKLPKKIKDCCNSVTNKGEHCIKKTLSDGSRFSDILCSQHRDSWIADRSWKAIK